MFEFVKYLFYEDLLAGEVGLAGKLLLYFGKFYEFVCSTVVFRKGQLSY